MPVNPNLPEPEPPGEVQPWHVECPGCGSSFKGFKVPIRFVDGIALLRSTSDAQGIEGGGWRSRRAVLWAMHVLKVQAWYAEHRACTSQNSSGETA